MRLTDQLLAVAAAFASASDLSEATVSTQVFRSGQRLQRLREGKDMLSRNVEAGLQWFSDRWPEDEPWPVHVPRPARSPSAPAGPPV